MICLVPFGYPFFPKYAIVDFLKLRLRTWVRTSDSGRCRLPRLQHKKNPWSADPGPGPKKIKICTQVITTEMSPDEMFFGKKKKVFLFVASHDQVQSFCWVLFWTASSSCMKKTGTKKPRTETQSHGNSLQSDFPCHFQMMEITPQKTNEWLLLQEKQPWMKMFLRFSYYFPLSC